MGEDFCRTQRRNVTGLVGIAAYQCAQHQRPLSQKNRPEILFKNQTLKIRLKFFLQLFVLQSLLHGCDQIAQF